MSSNIKINDFSCWSNNMFCLGQTHNFFIFFHFFHLMQKTELNRNHAKMKTFPANKKKISFPLPKPQKTNICTILLRMSKTPFLAASAAADTEWSHITLCWWAFHSQIGRRSRLVRTKQTSLVHCVKWTNRPRI